MAQVREEWWNEREIEGSQGKGRKAMFWRHRKAKEESMSGWTDRSLTSSLFDWPCFFFFRVVLCLWLSYCQVSWLVGLRASASLIFCCSGWYLFRYRLLSELCVLHRWLFRVIDVINLLLFACLTVLAVLGPITADYQWNCGFIHVSIESSLFLVHSLFLLSCSCRLQSVSIVPHIFLSLSLLLSRFLLRLRIQFLSLPWTYDL